ncbi:hypothetical protein LSAT2_007035, partial [Lamellibrachia satsuma]
VTAVSGCSAGVSGRAVAVTMSASDDNTITLAVETFSNKKHPYVLPRPRVPTKRDLFCWQYSVIVILAVGLISFSMWLSMSLFWRETLRSQLLNACEQRSEAAKAGGRLNLTEIVWALNNSQSAPSHGRLAADRRRLV